MHRKQDSDLFPADTELERTLRSLRKTKRAENAAMADERHDKTVEQRTAARRPPITDTMEDFWRPIIQEEYYAIRQPIVDANNFKLKTALITMVQQHQFIGHPTEDPNEHLGRFLSMVNTVKLNKSPYITDILPKISIKSSFSYVPHKLDISTIFRLLTDISSILPTFCRNLDQTIIDGRYCFEPYQYSIYR